MSYIKFSRRALCCFYTAFSFLLISCSGSAEFYRNIDENISNRNYLEAVRNTERNRKLYGDKNSVLYNLDLGMLFHYAGEYDSSNGCFFEAEKEIEDLYTKSISQQALSFVLNDNILPYEGEDFEKVLINLFLAVNYTEEGMKDDAIVEAKKVDLKLREYEREYEGKNTYKEDAFIRYLAGLIYEAGGEINDAFISYRKAYEAYSVYEKEYKTRTPAFLLDDLVRTASNLQFTEEKEEYISLGGKPPVNEMEANGTVIAIIYSGKGPIKIEERPTVSIPDTSGIIHTFQIALPKFVARSEFSRDYIIHAISDYDTSEVKFEIGEDITAIAEKALKDRLTYIYLKSGGRALLKFLASEKIKSETKKKNDKLESFLGSVAVDVVLGATEKADVRTWRTLPSEVQIARLVLPAGNYKYQITESDKPVLEGNNIEVEAGKTAFIIVPDVR